MSFKSDRQRRAAFAAMNNKFSCPPEVVYAQRPMTGLEVLSGAGEKLAGGVVATFPGEETVSHGYVDAYTEPETNAISALWPDERAGMGLDDLVSGMVVSTWPGDNGRSVVVVRG